MSRYTYTGTEKVCFSHYLDVTDPEHPVTLTAAPGETYDIKQADAPHVIQPNGQFTDQELAMPPSDDWKPEAKAAAKKKDGPADA